MISGTQRQLVRDYFSPFNKATGKPYDPETLGKIIAEFSEFYFGDPGQEAHWHIRDPIPDFHRHIYRDLAQELRFYYITCPSEFGKTTLATLTQELSQDEHLDNIKRELEENEKLLEFFGEQKPARVSRLTRHRPWSAAEVELPTGVVLRALGCMGKIRGRKSGPIRPTLVIVDDPEEAEDVDSCTVSTTV
ncbi:MAG: hypothetical protein JRJ01_16340 [Deltaproteobacteria bacterium]|nr:hypothetical protein [Deltaproteobacteria bacterium]